MPPILTGAVPGRRDRSNGTLHAYRLVHLYAEKESPKFERAAMRRLERYLAEKSPTLQNFAKVVRGFAERDLVSRPE